MLRQLWPASFLTVLCLAASAGDARGQAPAGDSFALRAGHVYTVTREGPQVLEPGVIVVRDGVITAVGEALDLPPDLDHVELPEAHVAPGFIAAAAGLGGRHSGDESVAAAYRAIDGFDRYGRHPLVVDEGVTTVHLDPGRHRLLTGQGAVVRLAGPPSERVLRASADLHIQLGVYGPPGDLEIPFPASSDVEIEPPTPQRPTSRIGQLLGLDEALESALSGEEEGERKYDPQRRALARAWRSGVPLRIGADAAPDLLAALSFLDAHRRRGVLVGGRDAARVAGSLARSGVPLVFRPGGAFTRAGADLGTAPEAREGRFEDLPALAAAGIPLALAAADGRLQSLRLTAVAARGAGLPEHLALAAITRVPAEILGVADRVGSIAPGRDADLIVLSGAPLEVQSHVRRVYVRGRRVDRRDDAPRALVVRAGTIWVSPERQIQDGEVLVEKGRIAAVGASVPHPPSARVIDAGRDGFVAPGFIDGLGHLGLEGDRSTVNADVDLTRAVGVPDSAELRVARAGVTTTLRTGYRWGSRGARVSAVKTGGRSRSDRVVREVAAYGLDVTGRDPISIGSAISGLLSRARRYEQKWKKYEKELAEYLAKQKRGEEDRGELVEEEGKTPEDDPISGTWSGSARGGPLPEPVQGKAALRLEGSAIEGRIVDPPVPIEHRILLTLNGTAITGHIEVDTGGMGYPQVEAELVAEDRIEGRMSLMGISVEFEATRTDKGPVEFRVERRITRRGGRPRPPKLDPALEPLRPVLAKKAPILVRATTPAEIDAVLDVVEKEKVALVLLDATGAELHAGRLEKAEVGVVLQRTPVHRRRARLVNQGDVLQRAGIRVAFQSGVEDGARHLPLAVLGAVERGMGADAALAALTTDAARLYRIDDRVGSLEPGRDADLIICKGHPFRAGSRVERVIIGGQEAQ